MRPKIQRGKSKPDAIQGGKPRKLSYRACTIWPLRGKLTMQKISSFKSTAKSQIKYLFTDIDDTLTTDGKLPAAAYEKIWELSKMGIAVIPVTGRPAGWCDMIARFWPVAAVIGENGAFYFSYQNQKMKRVWAYGEDQRLKYQQGLKNIEQEILKKIPKAAVSADQFSRLFDLAIDFCEDIPALSKNEVEQIVEIFKAHGAQAKVSSIHVNGWFGDHNKLTMCEQYCRTELGFELSKNLDACAFAGDSPNDEPMFEFFKYSFGVANVLDFKDQMKFLPAFITEKKGGEGFVEIATALN
jgi:HAD superfamily hydrolase (TIGR01484 family)